MRNWFSLINEIAIAFSVKNDSVQVLWAPKEKFKKKNKRLVFYDEVGKWLNKNKFLRHFCYNLCKALQLKIQVPKFRLDVTLNRKEKLKKYLYHFIKLQNFSFLPSSFIFLCEWLLILSSYQKLTTNVIFK